VNFTSDNGTPLTVPLIGGCSTTVAIAPQATTIGEALNTGPLNQGYVTTTLPDGVTAYGIFRQSVPGVPDQEAVVPFSDASSNRQGATLGRYGLCDGCSHYESKHSAYYRLNHRLECCGQCYRKFLVAAAGGGARQKRVAHFPGLSVIVGSRDTHRFAVTQRASHWFDQ